MQVAALAIHGGIIGARPPLQPIKASPTAASPTPTPQPEAQCAKLQSTSWQAARPEPDPGAPQESLLRSWSRVLIGGQATQVLLAQNTDEVALSVDDGASWSRHSLGENRSEALLPAVLQGDGSALLALGPRTWMRLDKSEKQMLTAPFSEPILQWVSMGSSVVALVEEESDLPLLRYSADGGASWHKGPNAPRGAHELAVLDDNEVAISYAWDVSCGGGEEGVVRYRLGEANWKETPQHSLGHLGAALWVLSERCDGVSDAICAWPPTEGAKPALGPALPAGGAWQWFSRNREASFVGGMRAVYRVENGRFNALSEDAPSNLHAVVVSDSGQLAGIANGHVVRWSETAGWRVHLP